MSVRFVPSFALLAVTAFGASSVQAAVPYGPGALAILVRDAKGNAIVGALVVATGPVSRRATTLDGGLVVLQALPLGTYDVSVTRAGYASVELSTVVKAATNNPQFVNLRLVPADFTNASEAAATLATGENPADDPFVAHLLAAAPGIAVVPGSELGGLAAVLNGTTPLESRVERDGIPVAGSPSGPGALRFGSALALDAVDVLPNLASAPLDTPLGTVGGIVNYRTAPISEGPSAGAAAGYDSSYGSFQRSRYSQTFGPFGVLGDFVTGGGQDRAQVLKARYGFSRATSLGVSSYGSQSSALVGNEVVTNIAPAAAIELKTGFGPVNFEARTYRSNMRTNETAPGFDFSSDDRLLGTQLQMEVPVGAGSAWATFDRRSERAIVPSTTLVRTYSTVSAGAAVVLAPALRLELVDAYGGGTQLARRHDPQAALTLGRGEPWSLRLSAGSAYATLPLDTLASLPPRESETNPETSFGYRVALNLRFDGNDRVWASAFMQRRFNTLSALSQAKSRGFELGIERTENAAGLGGLAYLDLQRAYGFGALQPFARAFTLPAIAGDQIYGDAYSKARLALSYRAPLGVAVRIGTTFLGPNNAFAGRAFALGDASLAIPLGGLFDARFGVENAFGHPITDPFLAAEYAPHEVTFSIGRR